MVTQYAEWQSQDVNQVLCDHTEQALGPSGTREVDCAATEQRLPQPEQEEPLGLQRAKAALGFKSRKALSLRVWQCRKFSQPRICRERKAPGDHPISRSQIYLQGRSRESSLLAVRPLFPRDSICFVTSDFISIYVNGVHYGGQGRACT